MGYWLHKNLPSPMAGPCPAHPGATNMTHWAPANGTPVETLDFLAALGR